MFFQTVESLQQVVNIVNEAAAAVNDKSRTIRESAIPEVLTDALFEEFCVGRFVVFE